MLCVIADQEMDCVMWEGDWINQSNCSPPKQLNLKPTFDLSYEISILVQSNSKNIYAYLTAIGNELFQKENSYSYIIEFAQRNADHNGVKELLPVIQGLNQFHLKEDIDFYKSFFSTPWAPQFDIEKKHYGKSKQFYLT